MGALDYQLAACVDDEGIDAMVLADGDGLLVARWGDADICEAAAAFAPLTAVEGEDTKRMRFGNLDLYLCALGGEAASRRRSIERSASGVLRILGNWLVA